MATPKLDFDPFNDAPAQPASSITRAAAKPSAIDFDPWSDGPAANDNPRGAAPASRTAHERTTAQTVDDVAYAVRRGTRNLVSGALGLPVNLVNASTAAPRNATRLSEAIGGHVPEIAKIGAVEQPAFVRGMRESLAEQDDTDRARWASEKLKAQESEFQAQDGFIDSAKYLATNPSLTGVLAAEQLPQMLVRVKGSTAGTIGAQATSAASQNAAGVERTLREAGTSEQDIADRASDAFSTSLGINSVLPMATPGGAVAERVLAGQAGRTVGGVTARIVKGAAGEAVSEASTEGLDQITQNVASGRPWDEGAGQAAALGGTIGAGVGAPAGAIDASSTRAAPQGNEPPPEMRGLPAPDRTQDFGVIRVGPDGVAATQAQAVQGGHPGYSQAQADPSGSTQPSTVETTAVPFPEATPGSLADASNAMPIRGPRTHEQRMADIALDARDAKNSRQKASQLDALARDSALPVALQDAQQRDAMRQATGADAVESAPTAMQLAMQRAQQEAGATRAQAETMRATAQGPMSRIAADVLDQRADALDAQARPEVGGYPSTDRAAVPGEQLQDVAGAQALDFDPHVDLPADPTPITYGSRRQQANQGADPVATARAQDRIDKMFGEASSAAELDFDPHAASPVQEAAASAVQAAAAEAATSPNNDRPLPTEAQQDAGNYKKGHTKVAGLDISIENPAGTKRRPEWPALKHHYGYIKGTIGKDKDHVDVFLTDKAEDTSLPVFVVDQNNADGSLDEHKVIMGAANEAEARKTYLANYSKGWKGLGGIKQMSQDEFKTWVRDPVATKKRAATVKATTQVPDGLDFDPHLDTPAGPGLRREHAERLVRRFTKGMPNHPQVVLVDDAEALHRAAGAQPGSDGTRAEGMYNGKAAVFINTASIDSPKRFRQVLAHEALGHAGVEQVVGKQWPQIAKTIVRHVENGTGAPWMRKAIDQAQASQPDVMDPVKLAKEVVAVMAEQGSRNGLINTVIARTRATLRQAIPSVQWTDGDVRDLLSQADSYLRGGKPRAALPAGTSNTGSLGDALYSKPGAVPLDTARVAPEFGHVTGKQREALGKISTHQPRETLTARATRLTENWKAKVVQGTVDQFHAFKDLDETAYMQARLSKGTDGTVEGVFRYGRPKLTDGALDITPDGKGFLGHMQDLGGEHDLFLAWVAGHRSEQLATEGREHLFTGDDITALKSLAKGRMADGRSREAVYRNALKSLNRYQSAILDIAQEAGEINAASRARWGTDFYLPFFRDMAGSPAPTPSPNRGGDNPGDIAEMRKQVIERLVGGGQPLNDLLENTLSNWSRLLSASMKNMAATRALNAAVEIGAAKQMPGPERGTVSAMFKGERKHFEVSDPLVLESLVMLYMPPWSNPAMKGLQFFKRALTLGVTTDPTFRVRNLLRDTMSVIATNKLSYNPLRNLSQGWKATEKGSDTYLRLLGGGGAIRFGSVLDGDQAAHAKRLIASGLATDDQILSTPTKLKSALVKAWDAYQEFGDRAETVNRAALYEQERAAGKDHLQASYAARDTLDFTNAGAWSSIQFLTRTVPFMNARLQGLYKLGRSAKQDPRRFAAVAGAVAMASVLMHLINADDEDYRALPDWVRDSYWWVKLPGTRHAVYIPKPFELGALGSVTERATELMTAGDDYRAKDFATTMLSILSQQLSMNPTPQAVKPGIEAAFNRNTFQDRPIDGMGQERLPPGDRYTARTSGGAVALGKLTNSSPQKIEHMVRGYFGWLGLQALNVSDLMTRDALDLGSNPANDFRKVDNIALIGSFIRARDAGSSKYVTRFYDQQKQVDMLYAAYAAARQAGDLERARELAGDDRLKLRGLYQASDREMTKINRRIRQVTSDKRLSSEAKGELLGGLYGTRDKLAERATTRARQITKAQEAQP